MAWCVHVCTCVSVLVCSKADEDAGKCVDDDEGWPSHQLILQPLAVVVPLARRRPLTDVTQIYSCTSVLHIHICDVICEKGPYCGTNIIGPDQTPRMMRGI